MSAECIRVDSGARYYARYFSEVAALSYRYKFGTLVVALRMSSDDDVPPLTQKHSAKHYTTFRYYSVTFTE